MARIDFLDVALAMDVDRCILWPFARQTHGYGMASLDGRVTLVHRVICKRAYGPPPDGKPHAIHSCDNPQCVNKRHIRWGSHADNMREMFSKNRRIARGMKGEEHHQSKLTEKDVVAIRAAHAKGISIQAISRKFGVVRGTIGFIVYRQTWKHVA